MRTFILSNIDPSIPHYELNPALKKFGNISKNIFLKDDRNNAGKQFGYANFDTLNDEDGFIKYCQEKNIKYYEQKNKPSSHGSHKDHNINKNVSSHHRNNNQRNEDKKNSNKGTKSIYNPSFYFYKDEAYGKDIENFSFTNNYKELFEIPDVQTFKLTTTYPGLLVGSGYNHPKLKNDQDDFQLGFFFDHTTGLPLISGSSIKGVLKSVISNQEFMDDVYKKTIPLEIFKDNETVFYDAFIVATKDRENKIFGSDFITSHYSNEENGEFKNPNPVKFLKILPDVTFQFQFKCEEKYRDIFKEIIIDFGLGAKTNVGYGKFVE